SLDLVVAGPEHDARVIAQTLDVVDRFGANAVEKLLRRRIHAASEHEILPDKNSHLIAKLVKLVGFVDSATPDAQHIHVAVAHGFDQKPVFIFGDARWKTVGRDPVSAFRKDRNSVDYKHEALARVIALLAEFKGS